MSYIVAPFDGVQVNTRDGPGVPEISHTGTWLDSVNVLGLVAAITMNVPVSMLLADCVMSYAVADQVMVRGVLNARENVRLCELPLTLLCSTALPSFQFTSTFERFPST